METTLIIGEHANGQLRAGCASACTLARQVGGEFDIVLLGSKLGPVADSASGYGARSVIAISHSTLEEPLADSYAQAIAQVARRQASTLIVAAVSTFSKDILPRVAALLDAGMLSDVIGVKSDPEGLVFRRILYAGNVIATVRLEGPIKCLTFRGSAFAAAEKSRPLSPVSVVAEGYPSQIEFVGREQKAAGRPDPTEARIVVSGGRALKNAEDFERLVGGLADVLGGAVGSSRALVDAGITANTLQVGQTGKNVAPDLYIAVGVSGAIQHIAGMKDSKVIVAINKDPEAPIFEVADFGLVADIYQAVPELIGKLKGLAGR